MYQLLAKSPSGEMYFTRDIYNVVRRHNILSGGFPLEVGEGHVDWAVTEHGYQRCNESFDSLVDAETFVRDSVAKTTLNAADLPVTPRIAQSALRLMAKWLDSPADRSRIVPTATRLLQSDAVSGDHELRHELLTFIERANHL